MADDLLQRLQRRMRDATQRLEDAQGELVAVQAKIARAKLEVEICRQVLEGEEIESEPVRAPFRNADANGNGHQGQLIGYGATAHAVMDVLRRADGPLTMPDIVERVVASARDTLGTDRVKIKNNVGSMLYRAVRDLQHPVFRKVGVGKFDLTERVETAAEK